jgi:predicted ester cyclase
MNTEQNKQLIRRILVEGMGRNRPDVIDETVAPDYVNYDFPQPEPGREGFKRTVAMFNAAFSDGYVVVEDEIAEGNKVVTRGYLSGTHTGPFLGVAPTGKRIKLPYIDIWTIQDGKGHENWVQLDLLGLMQQLGVVPAPEEAAM